MKFSVLIVSYDMERELPRTIFSVAPYYQKFNQNDYEILAVQNGGKIIEEKYIKSIAPNAKNFTPKQIITSPCYAINDAANNANGEYLIICIDGARIWSNRILIEFSQILNKNEDSIIVVPSYHLGWDKQSVSSETGYNQRVEDRAIRNINWPIKPRNLFKISSPAGSNRGLFNIPAESNCICISKKLFFEIGGYNENFTLPGGGFCNLEFFQRIVNSNAQIIQLEHEGTFHQIHGGQSTNNDDPGNWVELGRKEMIDKGISYSSEYMEKENLNFNFLYKNNGNIIQSNFKRHKKGYSRDFYFKGNKAKLGRLSLRHYLIKFISFFTLSLQNTEIGRSYRKRIKKILEFLRLNSLIKIIIKNGL
tara:strand:- start:3374 stop:4465 length:1092 start_codon:yes stop_codon:yes gene_type:complete